MGEGQSYRCDWSGARFQAPATHTSFPNRLQMLERKHARAHHLIGHLPTYIYTQSGARKALTATKWDEGLPVTVLLARTVFGECECDGDLVTTPTPAVPSSRATLHRNRAYIYIYIHEGFELASRPQTSRQSSAHPGRAGCILQSQLPTTMLPPHQKKCNRTADSNSLRRSAKHLAAVVNPSTSRRLWKPLRCRLYSGTSRTTSGLMTTTRMSCFKAFARNNKSQNSIKCRPLRARGCD